VTERELLEKIKASQYVVALTGAGVSTESGIPDFRGPNGLYSKYPENVFDIDYFYADPEGFYRFWREALFPMNEAKPNVVHTLLAELEAQRLLKAVVTQNIDGLHQKAGSKNVIELHGNIFEYCCAKCGRTQRFETVKKLLESNPVPRCNCGGLIRPNIVFFGESLPMHALSEATLHAQECDLMIVLGSSLVVYPAAQLPIIAKEHGAALFIVNRGRTGLDDLADFKFDVNLSDFAKELMKHLMKT